MSAYQRKMKRLAQAERFSSLLPFLEYWDEDELFLLEGPSIGVMFVGTPTNGGNLEILNGLNNLYKSSFPKDTIIQASIISLPDIEDMLYGYRSRRHQRNMGPDQEQVQAIADAIHDFYRQGTTTPINQSGFLFRNFEFWFTLKIPTKELIPTQEEIDKLKGIKKRLERSLDMFAVRAVDEAMFRRKMRVMFNLYDESGWRKKPSFRDKCQSTQPLRELCLEPGKYAEIERNGVAINNGAGETQQYIKSLSITEMPEQMVYGQMMDLMGDWMEGRSKSFSEHFMLTLNLHYSDQNKERSDIASKRTFINSQAKGKIVQYLDRLRFQNKDFNDVNRELDQERPAIVQYSLQMTVFGKDKLSANAFADELRAFYERKKITVVDDSHFTTPFFIASVPFGLSKEFVRFSGRFNRCTSKALPFLTPHMASWAGNCAYPSILLASRLGQVVNLDFFKSQTNYNFYIAATSGAGKSFFTGYLINNMLAAGQEIQPDPDSPEFIKDYNDGSQVFVIDVGRSYEGLAEQFEDAQFLVFNKDIPYTLNPFAYIHEFDGKEGQGIQCLAQLKTMAAPSGKITDFQNSEMLTLLTELWNQKGNRSTIDDFSAMCIGSHHESIKAIGIQLKPFCQDGYYGKFFAPGKPPVNFNSRLVVVELEELKSDAHLQTVVLMSVIMSIQQAMYMSGTERQKLFLLDEAWEYLKGDDQTKARLSFFASFLETAWRRFRKYNAAGGLITQSVMDGYSSDVGRAILDNSNWLLLLKQRNEAVDKLQSEEAYSGSEADYKMIKSVTTVQPNPSVTDVAFSEVFINYEGVRQVCRLYTDRRIQLLLTTRGDEKNARQKYIDRGLSLTEAVTQMVADEEARKRKSA
jgi:conjugal transfer ATP-binding protein TraC